MKIVKHHKLKQDLSQIDKDNLSKLILICGENYLVEQAVNQVLCVLLGDKIDPFAKEVIDASAIGLGDIIEQVSTFSFPTMEKVFLVKNVPLFQSDSTPGAIRYNSGDLDVLSNFITSGWPQSHTLVLTTGSADKRKKIFKQIAETGMVVDCSVSKGVRKADLDEQHAVMNHVAAQILKKYNKELDPKAFIDLVDSTGFNLDLFRQNLQKLAAFTADRTVIFSSDVNSVVPKDRKDPIFNLTNALMDKSVKTSLEYLNSLINDGAHPLQILKAMENQFRKLLIARETLNHIYPEGSGLLKHMTFNQFKQSVMAKIVKADNNLLMHVKNSPEGLLQKKGKKIESPRDLFLAPNPKNAYPVFQLFKKSENYSLKELYYILYFLSEIEYNLKTSSLDALTQIESLILQLCRKGGFVHAPENKNHRYNLQ